MLVVGLISGTSMDGITAALVEMKQGPSGDDLDLDVNLLDWINKEYPPQVKEKLLVLREEGTVPELCALNFLLGDYFAEAALEVIKRAEKSPEQIDLICNHGQTICHLPQRFVESEFGVSSTLQIGESDVIVERTGITTIGDFRTRDMAAGGEAAPLIPYVDHILFRSKTHARVLLNLGGIANVTHMPASATLEDLVAFDTGPASMIIDGVVEHLTQGQKVYDENGVMAGQGRIDESFLDMLMQHPFIHLPPPKSTGREEFGKDFLHELLHKAEAAQLDGNDLVATVTAFSAASLVLNCQTFLDGFDELIVGGGGAHNQTLLKMIDARLNDVKIMTTQSMGIPVEAKEAIGFAIMGYQAFHGRPNNVPNATGAKYPVVMGKISPSYQKALPWQA